MAARLAWEPRVVGAALSPTPIFNWLLFGYGAPALAFGFAARLMRGRGEDTPVRVADALAVLFSAFLVFFEIRHATNGGDPFARGSGLVEQGLMAVSSFGFALVLTRLDAARANPVFRWASLGRRRARRRGRGDLAAAALEPVPRRRRPSRAERSSTRCC